MCAITRDSPTIIYYMPSQDRWSHSTRKAGPCFDSLGCSWPITAIHLHIVRNREVIGACHAMTMRSCVCTATTDLRVAPPVDQGCTI
eukprot:COSAG01_NODE_795_length_13541_cov_5.530725_6_plen_87_part_00